jgi:hypothetical protein
VRTTKIQRQEPKLPSPKEIARRTEAAAELMHVATVTNTLRLKQCPDVDIMRLAWESGPEASAVGTMFAARQVQHIANAQGLTSLKRPAKELRRLLVLAVEAAMEERRSSDGYYSPSGNSPNAVYRWWFVGQKAADIARTLDPTITEEA